MKAHILLICCAAAIGLFNQKSGYAQQRVLHEDLIISSGLASYSGSLYSGISFTVWENDSLRTEWTWQRGKLSGPFREYYVTGVLAIKANYISNLFEGEYVAYYPNGTLSKREFYKNGSLDGIVEEYYPDGGLRMKGVKKDGLWDGAYEEYFSNGQLKIKSTRVKGSWDGSYEEYLENGTLYLRGRYKDGFFKRRGD